MQENQRLSVLITRLPHFDSGFGLPRYQSDLAAGMDLIASLDMGAELVIWPKTYELVPTGIAIALPPGYEAQVRPRSGLAVKHGISVLNAPGTIDADFRGEIKVALINHGRLKFVVERGMRIAQLVVASVIQVAWDEVDALPETVRGAGGFGSTGT